MMMKQSRWMMLLVALICLSMLLASCDSDTEEPFGEENSSGPADSNGDKTPDTNGNVENEDPGNETVDYRALAAEWSKYLEYTPSEKTAAKTATLMFQTDLNDQRDYGVFVRKDTLVAEYLSETPSYKEYKTTIYSKATGQVAVPAITYRLNDDRSDAAVKYSFNYTDAVVEVKKGVWDETEGLYVYTYDYYTSESEKVNAEPLEESVLDEAYSYPYSYSYVGDTCYISRDGVIVETCARGTEIAPKKYDITYGSFGYVYGYNSYEIYDLESQELLIQYRTDSNYDTCISNELSNGNVLLRCKKECYGGDDRYNVEAADGTKYFYCYVLLDAATGSATELPVEFEIAKLITKSAGDYYNLIPKGDYQYAEIYKLTDGKRAATKTPVILDNNLKIVAELPLLLKNQTSIECALTESFWVFGLEVAGTRYFYSVDLTTGRVDPHVFPGGDGRDIVLDGGFLFDGTLYNNLMTPLVSVSFKDATRIDSITLGGSERLMVTIPAADGETRTYLVYIEDGQARSVLIADTNDYIQTWYGYDDFFKVEVRDNFGSFRGYRLFNMNGEELFSGESISIEENYGDAVYLRCENENGTTSYYCVR